MLSWNKTLYLECYSLTFIDWVFIIFSIDICLLSSFSIFFSLYTLSHVRLSYVIKRTYLLTNLKQWPIYSVCSSQFSCAYLSSESSGCEVDLGGAQAIKLSEKWTAFNNCLTITHFPHRVKSPKQLTLDFFLGASQTRAGFTLNRALFRKNVGPQGP